MSESITPLAFGETRTPKVPTAEVAGDAGATRMDPDVGRPSRVGGARPDRYHETLAALHKRRREVLQLKRLGSPGYDEEEYQQLREYIDDLQKSIVTSEEQQYHATLERFEVLADQVLARLPR